VTQPPRRLGVVPSRPPSGRSDRPPAGLTQRRASEARRQAALKSLQRFVRQEFWNGLAAGDVVRVAGHRSRGRHWLFRAHVTNTSNGASWVEVALVDGPPPARPTRKEGALGLDAGGTAIAGPLARIEKVRSIDPALVTPRRAPRRSPPSPEPLLGNGSGEGRLLETEAPKARPERRGPDPSAVMVPADGAAEGVLFGLGSLLHGDGGAPV
jgi:hypothetical protein